MRKNELPIDEELDFAYLLTLLPPLYNVPEFSWLSELFSIIGHERLLTLCKYCGGEKIKIPTLDQLSESIDALQAFYDLDISKTKSMTEIDPHLFILIDKIRQVYKENNDASYTEGRFEIRKIED